MMKVFSIAIEKMIDQISWDYPALSKIVKDIASSAVFVTYLICILVEIIVLLSLFGLI